MPLQAADELNVFISEFRVRGPNGADDEFVEIYNASGGNVDIGNWIIVKSSGCGATETTLTTIPINTILAPGQYYLVVKDGYYSGAITHLAP
ncbi:MAG: lamin tail domain-containing protein [Anaerolineales bacterium]|nr:lamin tail domain-containing protein [Anaerolineales bacterium]